jgi:hypothetical protein
MSWGAWLTAVSLFAAVSAAAQGGWVQTSPAASGVALSNSQGTAAVVTAASDYEVVRIAAEDLRRDLETVTGKPSGSGNGQIWAGTLGRNPAIDRLAAAGKLQVDKLKQCWECFTIATVERPSPTVPRALVIVGSDRRGTAYGIYELSRAIGVSPWHWWADVRPVHHDVLYVKRGTLRFGPPSVKYRGIFINDEDWGLAPWAATNFEPEHGGIGPKTYAKVFELLLRLKANTLWPAMHKISPAFNSDPENARLADRYAIVMGSSHAEPMLRNNVREWTADPHDYDYGKNPAGVRDYWEDRVRTNGLYENIYTLGMRGIHDSGMQGADDMPTRRRFLESIFADQRAMIGRHVSPHVERVPQVFTPYKEVLDVYRSGLTVPDDVTIMWPDDNFGYIRRFPNALERRRSGGSGIYYHLSYLGAPLSYLWLSTTPPALVEEEMGRAFDLGADRMWIANVGDIKPGELAMDYFLSLAWDVPGTRARGVDDFLKRWAAENVDAGQSVEIARLLAEHYRLNFIRRPEHLQWWLPGQQPRQSPYSIGEGDERLREFDANVARLKAIETGIDPVRRDAFFELLAYPVQAAAEANRRFFAAEGHDRLRDENLVEALRRAGAARAADTAIATLTAHYDSLNGGKWRGLIAPEPADGQWAFLRISAPVVPRHYDAQPYAPRSAAPTVSLDLRRLAGNWRRVAGLGHDGVALASSVREPVAGSGLVDLPTGTWRPVVSLIPTYPGHDGEPLILTVKFGDQTFPLRVARQTGDAEWAKAVLDNRISIPLPVTLGKGPQRIELRADGGGVLVDSIRFEPEKP